ncbi:MAG: tetratricopeptide repeat protein [Bacteroidales bacterium]|nr:tetratricopeptide repeat protein [Bacteroidales bacterium]
MEKNRFKNYNNEVKQLVLDFEHMEKAGESRYFDVEQLEDIIDFYLDSYDLDQLTRAVEYAEYLYPQSDEIVLRRAHMLCAKEKFDEALRLLRRLEEQQPENTDVMYALAGTYSAMDQPRKAIQYYLRAAKDGLELDMVYGNIGDEYMRLQMNDSALAYYKKALQANPDETRCIYAMADIFTQDDTLDESIHFFSQFVEKNPYSAAGWLVLGEAYRGKGLYEQAESALKYALAVDDKFFPAYDALAQTYDLLNQPAEAVRTLQEALPFTEDHSAVFYNMGQCYYHQNNAATAAVYFKKSLQEDPYNTDSREMLAYCYQDMNDAQAAIDNMQRLIDYEPHNVRYKEGLMKILMCFDYAEEAKRVFEDAMADIPDAGYFYVSYARELMDKRRYDEAMVVLKKCMENCEQDFEVYELLAVCYFRKKQLRETLECICKAFATDPELMDDIFADWPDVYDDPNISQLITELEKKK